MSEFSLNVSKFRKNNYFNTVHFHLSRPTENIYAHRYEIFETVDVAMVGMKQYSMVVGGLEDPFTLDNWKNLEFSLDK